MFYAVKIGRKPGVYDSWAECLAQVKNVAKARYKKFPTEEEAWNFVQGTEDGGLPSSQEESPVPEDASAVSPQLLMALDAVRFTAVSLTEQARQLTASIASLTSQVEALQAAFQLSAHVAASPAKSAGATGLASKHETGSQSPSRSATRSSSSTTAFGVGDFVPLGKAVDPALRPASVKRAFSSDTGSNVDAPRLKRNKTDTGVGGISGLPFDETKGKAVYTDGACFNNGKNGAAAGIGVWWGHDDPNNVSERLPGRPTNNRAEIHAAVKAVMQAKKMGISKLILYTDSEFLINSITKWIKGWKKNGWILTTGQPVVNREDFEKLDAALVGMHVKWVHVRGHQGNEGNEAADRLANVGARMPLK